MPPTATSATDLLTGFQRVVGGFGVARDETESAQSPWMRYAPAALTAAALALLFGRVLASLAVDWWVLPEAGHGLLLAPVAVWMAWKTGIGDDVRPNRALGITLLFLAVAIRLASELAAELYTMRGSMILALVGLTVYHYGVRQVVRWWLPFLLAGLAVPLPEIVTQALALPLQFKASQMGAALLETRQIPVHLAGNVIRLPGQELFVTEACSGLRSLTALLSVGVLVAALFCRHPVTRILVIGVGIPIAILVNGVRVFMTGFLVYFVDPALGKGFMHATEGWLLFLVSMSLLAGCTWLLVKGEDLLLRQASSHA